MSLELLNAFMNPRWAKGSKSPWNDDPPKPDKEKKPKECNELAVHALVANTAVMLSCTVALQALPC